MMKFDIFSSITQPNPTQQVIQQYDNHGLIKKLYAFILDERTIIFIFCIKYDYT